MWYNVTQIKTQFKVSGVDMSKIGVASLVMGL